MKKNIALTNLFFVCVLIFVIALMPARVALDFAKPMMPKTLKINQVHGSIWQGGAVAVSFEQHQLDNVTWDLSAWSLLTASLAGDIKFGKRREMSAPYGHSDFSVSLISQQLLLSNSSLRVPSDMVMSQLDLPMPMKSKGHINLKLAEGSPGKPYCDALNGTVSTQNLSVQGLQGWVDIDTVKGQLSCKKGALVFKINEKNVLGLQVEAELGEHGAKVSGFIKPDPSMPKQVHDAVTFLGRPDQSGRYSLRF